MRLRFAVTHWDRARGLLHRPRGWLQPDEALLMVPCDSIHTLFMGCAIDIAFLAVDGTVLLSERALAPWRLRRCKGAVAVLERPVSPGFWPREGCRLNWDDVETSNR